MKYILWLSLIWIPVLIAWLNVNEARFKKNIAVGVTIPPQSQNDPEVTEILNVFRKREYAVCGGLILLGILCMFMTEGFSMTVWMLWIVGSIIVPYIPYIICNLQMKALKQEKGWVQQKHVVYADTSAVGEIRWMSPWLFVPPCILSAVPAFLDQDLAAVYILLAVFCVLFWFSYRWLYRTKAEMVDENTELTKVLTRIRHARWGKIWLLISWFMAMTSIIMFFSVKYPGYSYGALLLLTAAVTACSIGLEMNTRRLQEKLTEGSGKDWYVDEDDHWIFGMFYCNPNDARLIINNRVGLNSTVNIARKPGMIFMAFTGLILLSLPFSGIWFDGMDRQEILLEMTDSGTVHAHAGWTDYTVKTEEIEEMEVLYELPEGLSRRSGTGMEHLIKGRFTSERTGNMTVLADPTVPPYILIRTEDGSYYMFNARDAATTEQTAKEITARIQKE